jgi:hypothetical protein
MDGEVVFSYSLKEAEDDGVLVSVLGIWPDSLISHVTANLLSMGYQEETGGLRMANLVDLLNQAIRRIMAGSPDGVLTDFYSFKVEFPDGARRKVFAQMNEMGRLTLMLPEDY